MPSTPRIDRDACPSSSLTLHRVAVAVLGVALGGCCGNAADVTREYEIDRALTQAMLTAVRGDSPEELCESACLALLELEEGISMVDEITSCEASAASGEDPWEPGTTAVTIVCRAETTGPGFCTGRRPLGHAEATLAVDSTASWLAVHAHLERASVAAFEELAHWLSRRGAPVTLIDRCRVAAGDEVRHAIVLEGFALRHGAEVPALRADPHPQHLAAVAMHNAVEGCVREAFAAIVAGYQARRAEDPQVREAFEAIAADEVRHGQLAWDLHAWFSQQLPAADLRRSWSTSPPTMPDARPGRSGGLRLRWRKPWPPSSLASCPRRWPLDFALRLDRRGLPQTSGSRYHCDMAVSDDAEEQHRLVGAWLPTSWTNGRSAKGAWGWPGVRSTFGRKRTSTSSECMRVCASRSSLSRGTGDQIGTSR